MKNAITLAGVCKRFGKNDVLRNISLDLKQGCVTAIIGPSGCGKTTLLRSINGLTTIDAGTIQIADRTFTKESAQQEWNDARKNVGMVFQQFNLWPHNTVLQNLTKAPMMLRGMSEEDALKQALALLDRVQLSGKSNAYPSELSIGQQQRVAIARALAMNPAILLLDEITSALDPQLTEELSQVIRSLATEGNQTMILVTHELSLVRDIADEVVFLEGGSIVEKGRTDDVLRSQNPRTKNFVRKFAI